MYRSSPTPKNTYAKIAALVCLLLGMALFAIASLNLVDYPALPQTLGIFSLTASVYIASAFLLRRYTFSVDQNPQGELGELDFCIVENKGKREITVCRIGIDEIISVREVNKQNKKTVSEERKSMARHTYDVTFAPERRLEIVSRYDEQQFSILVTYDEALLDAINRAKKQ
jgi:hypothetical protein